MKSNYISRALCFHGQPMQKIWEDERGSDDLQKWGVSQQPTYSVYQERQKHFTFQDRAKRLKLHQFFARKAVDLYDAELGVSSGVVEENVLEKVLPYVAVMPPYESFVNKSQDKAKRRCVLEGIKPGDVVFGVIKAGGISFGQLMVKPLCTAKPLIRYLNDIPIKASVSCASIGTLPLDKRGKPRNFGVNDYVCCEVLDTSIDADRLTLGMEGVVTKNKNIKLGLVSAEELPAYYRKTNDSITEKFEDCLHKAREFLNPNYNVLFEINGLNVNDTFTMMTSLKNSFPPQDYAKELRQAQASKWAFRSVAEGIERFKIGHHVEAFQCLNKALSIDPQNVEGLVARGALYANKGSFLKAVEDFEKALKLNSYHVNARKYMGETLVALGRSYEEENHIQDAIKSYMDCLNIIPNHEQARSSLDALRQRNGNQFFDNLFNITGSAEIDKSKKKKRKSSSSVSESSSTDSGSSSNSESDSNHDKEASLSPLSKRMALHAASLKTPLDPTNLQFNKPFYAASYNAAPESVPNASDMNDFKLDEDDTESRVRKLLQDALKHKKEKSKKSKKKKSRKKKKFGHKDKDSTAILEKINFQDAYRAISSLNIENKLNQNLQIYEKTIAEIKRRQDILQQSISSSSSATGIARQPSESPPPKAPSMKIVETMPSTSRMPATTISYIPTAASTSSVKSQQPKLSFQIKPSVKVDKFGLARIATPLGLKSPTVVRSISSSISPKRKRHYRSRSKSKSSSSRPGSRSRSKSRKRRRSHTRDYPRRGRRSHSHVSRSSSTSPSRRRRYGRSYHSKRRTPSPFVPRGTPPRRRRSRSRRSRSRSPKNVRLFGNRVWQRPGYTPNSRKEKLSEGRWLHDKYNDDKEGNTKPSIDDGPSIEEIDEIINKAQKERKQEIIKRDKNILKKSTAH